jgi:deoxyribose-phosphate aldolase
MKKEELYRYVDHTALKAFTTWEEIRVLCQQAVFFRMASVCIPSCYVKLAHERFPELNICTVVGFPLGNANLEAKLAETRQALMDGANEIDMVINIGMVKNGKFDAVTDEIRQLKQAVGDHILKVIIETCYLTEEEKIKMCEAVTIAGADYIKTSTGFGTGGATLEDVELMKAHIGPGVKIKASGGIRSKEEMERFILAGCSRIGTSSAIEMLQNAE